MTIKDIQEIQEYYVIKIKELTNNSGMTVTFDSNINDGIYTISFKLLGILNLVVFESNTISFEISDGKNDIIQEIDLYVENLIQLDSYVFTVQEHEIPTYEIPPYVPDSELRPVAEQLTTID